jgi:hypothetical protein
MIEAKQWYEATLIDYILKICQIGWMQEREIENYQTTLDELVAK